MISKVNSVWFGYQQVKMYRLRNKKAVNRDFGKWKYITVEELGVIWSEILQVGHPNFICTHCIYFCTFDYECLS